MPKEPSYKKSVKRTRGRRSPNKGVWQDKFFPPEEPLPFRPAFLPTEKAQVDSSSPGSYIATYLPKVGKHWPECVFVLDKNSSVSGPTYCYPMNGEPCSINAWVDNEFRGMSSAKLSSIRIAISVWWSVHHYLMEYLKTKRHRTPTYTIYNAIWAYLGYTEGQDPDASALALSFRNSGGPKVPTLIEESYAQETKKHSKRRTTKGPRDRASPKR